MSADEAVTKGERIMLDKSWNPVNPNIARQVYQRIEFVSEAEREICQKEWLALRRAGVGASEVSAVLGQSSWASPFTIWGQKLGTIDPPEQTEAMVWGNKLEELILEAFAEETGRKVQRSRWTYRNIEYDFMLASPDGFQLSDHRSDAGLVQAKNTFIGWDEEIPKATWIQMQSEMAVTGLNWNTAVALAGGNRLFYKDIIRDADFIDKQLIPRLVDFWDYVVDAEPLPDSFIDGSAQTRKALQDLYPEIDDAEAVTLDGSFQGLHEERLTLKAGIKEKQLRVSEIENLIRYRAGEKTYAVLPDGGVYSFKTQTKKEEKHVRKASTTRPIRFKESEQK